MNNQETGREQELFRERLLTKWTAGLSLPEQRISIFSHIRDIPYAIVPGWQGTEDVERLMITENRGWCGPKHHLLSWMLIRLGITTRMVIIPFRWQDQPVDYPDSLRALVSSVPDTSHLCCRALLNGEWQILDATWDPPLGSVGFPINNPWDGISGTTPAVTRNEPAQKRLIARVSPDSRKERVKFVTELNQWLEEVRSRQRG